MKYIQEHFNQEGINMTSKEETMMLQGLMDWLGNEYETTGHIPTVEEMYMYLLVGYDKVYDDEYLEEFRYNFIEGTY